MSTAVEILYLVGGLGTGGTERHLARLLPLLPRQRFLPHVFNAGEAGTAASVLEEAGVVVEPFTSPVSVRDLPVFGRCVRQLRRRRPALVHSYLYGAHWLDALAARLAGVPYVGTRRNLAHWRAGPAGIRERWRDRSSQVIIASSSAAAAVARADGVRADSLRVIPNGVPVPELGGPRRQAAARSEARAALGIPGAARVVGSVGGLKKIKAPVVLLRAFARRRAAATGDRLVFIGNGPEAGPLAAAARDLGLENNLVLAGRRHEPADLLAAFDVFALASTSEGFSNALLEAMAAALPVVATAVGGNNEAVVDGVCGRLVPADDEAALAGALDECLADPERAAAWGRRGRERVIGRYSMQAMVDAHVRLYERLLSRRPALHRGQAA
ncbi:MAG: glycosyltransferase [Acidobacteriota bacterium]